MALETRHRWLRWLALGVAVVIVVVGGVYVWAWLSTGRSTIARALIWMEADVGDQERFPARPIPTGEDRSSLPIARENDELLVTAGGRKVALDTLLRERDTRAFVVVDSDRVVYERYYGDSGADTLETSWSVAKSFVSTLVGIAIDQGLIGGVDDPVTKYLPELAERDSRFSRITLGDLMSMRSGLHYEEASFPWPWGDDTYTYYGIDLRDVAFERTEIEAAPGAKWLYNNYNPLLLGLVLERVTGTSIAEYMSRVLWQPLGAARDATWSLDSERSGFEKMESGVNATARDYARFGQLFLHGGRWNGKQIVSQEWVSAATAVQAQTAYENPYGYFWWIDGQLPDRFYALGNYGQYIYVDPVANVVIVRLSGDWGVGNESWLATFREITRQLAS